LKQEPKICQVASIPEREEMLRVMVASILPQVDRLNVMLNGYNQVPSWLADSKITYTLLDNSTGDAAKFYGVERLKGYIFTCDDDILYPVDYIDRLTEAIERHYRRAIIAFHGRTMLPKPVRSYYRDRYEAFHYLFGLDYDAKVSTVGTGVMGFHSSTIRLKYADFRLPNMADIWIAKFAKEHGVPLVVARHGAMWLRSLDAEGKMPSIWGDHCNDDSEMTKLYNSF